MRNINKWELSLMAGAGAAILCRAAAPHFGLLWWTTAFSPLCDGILTSGAENDIVLRSKLWELLCGLF